MREYKRSLVPSAEPDGNRIEAVPACLLEGERNDREVIEGGCTVEELWRRVNIEVRIVEDSTAYVCPGRKAVAHVGL